MMEGWQENVFRSRWILINRQIIFEEENIAPRPPSM